MNERRDKGRVRPKKKRRGQFESSRAGVPWLSPKLLALLFLAAVVPYLRTLGFEYTYDDHSHIVRNPFLQNTENVWLLFTKYFQLEVPDQTRPVLLLTHFLDRYLAGADPKLAHLQSVIWHGFATVLVAKLGREVGLRAGVAFAAGLLFALHPALTEAVAGISNREDVLATVFSLLALLFSKRALAGRWGSAFASLFFLGVAVLSKEVAVIVPLILVSFVILLPDWRAATSRRGVLMLGLGASIVLGGWLSLQLRLGTPGLKRNSGAAPLQQAMLSGTSPPIAAANALSISDFAYRSALAKGTPERAVHAPLGLPHAAPLEAFRAVQLTFGYPTSSEYDLGMFRTPLAWVLSAFVLLGVAGGAARVRRSAPVAFVSVLFCFAATVPVLAPPLLINPLADRFLYLPAVGACWALSYVMLEAVPRWTGRDQRDVGLPLFVLWAGLFFALGVSSVERWRDDVALFSHAAKWAPASARVHQNLGAALLERGRIVEAEHALLEAVRLDPSLIAARYNLGTLSERANRRVSAIDHYLAGLSQPSIRGELGLRERILSRLGPLLIQAGRGPELERLLDEERAAYPENAAIGRMAERLGAAGASKGLPR